MMRNLLLGLDGATFTLLDPLIKLGEMPFLSRLIQSGSRATLASTPCPVTPPAWTSILTGCRPGRHGVFDFIVLDDSEDGRTPSRMTNARDVRAEPIWSVASRAGKASGILNFPNTFLADAFNGYMVPGFITSRVLRTNVHPREFWEQIRALPDFNVKDISWDLDDGEMSLSTLRPSQESMRSWVDGLKRKDRMWFSIARLLIEKTPCELIAVVFEGPDRLQHLMWDVLDPAFSRREPHPEERALRDYSCGYFRQLDDLCQQLVEAAGPDCRAFLVSDHGFGPTTEIFYVNAWLEKNGYLKWKSNAVDDTDGKLTIRDMRKHFEAIDWGRTVAYARSATANGIYLRVAQRPGQSGIPPDRYESVRAELIGRLLAYRAPSGGGPVVTRALTREEAFAGPAMADAPDLTLTLRDGGFVSILNSPEIVRQRTEVKGTHRPEGIFVAGGKDMRQGVTLPPLSVVDIAPTLLYSMGLPVPSDMDGRVIVEAFSSEHLSTVPVRVGAPGSTFAAAEPNRPDGGILSEADENAVLERLKALGYME